MMKNVNVETVHRLFLGVLILTSVLLLMLPEYLPLVDLAQHAAQVSSLDDLLKNRSAWHDILFIQWNTPYLTMYVFWLGLYQLFDIMWSAKMVVTAIFLFYMYAMVQVRKVFGATRLLDYVALTCFFGYAFQWGFLGYLSAIPVGFLFLVANKKWMETHQNRYLIHMTLLGVWAYYSHVLPYAFFCLLSYAYFLFDIKRHSWKQSMLFTAPYLLFAAILLHYLNTPDPAPLLGYFPTQTIQDNMMYKTMLLISIPWNMWEHPYYDLAGMVLYLAPFFLGYRLKKDIRLYVLFIATLLVWYILPRTVFQTFFVYIRFAIFVPIFYYLLWEARPLDKTWKKNSAQIAYLFFGISVAGLVFKQYDNHTAFNQSENMRDAKMVLAHMQPEKRVLGLFTTDGQTAGNLSYEHEYLHFIHQWYQAQKRGWADYSFAATHAMPVRLKSSALYQNYGNNRGISEENMVKILDCQIYDYLILHHNGIAVADIRSWLKQNPQCQNVRIVIEQPTVLLLENKVVH